MNHLLQHLLRENIRMNHFYKGIHFSSLPDAHTRDGERVSERLVDFETKLAPCINQVDLPNR